MLAIRRSPREPQPARQRLRCARDVLNAVLLLMVAPAGGVFGQCTFTVTSVGECAQGVHWPLGGQVSGDFSENRPVFAYGQLWLQLPITYARPGQSGEWHTPPMPADPNGCNDYCRRPRRVSRSTRGGPSPVAPVARVGRAPRSALPPTPSAERCPAMPRSSVVRCRGLGERPPSGPSSLAATVPGVRRSRLVSQC